MNIKNSLIRSLAMGIPVGLFFISLMVLPKVSTQESIEQGMLADELSSAGLFTPSKEIKSRRGLFSGSSSSQPKYSKPKRKPSSGSSKQKELTISKSSLSHDKVKLGKKRPGWKYMTREVRAPVDRAGITSGRWKYIVVHNSSTKRGGAKAFDNYHRNVKRMRNGMAYHFVIGNGSYTGTGQIEVGDRWAKQLQGGHMKSSAQNRVAIGICLVGDFDSDRVGRSQLEALDELVSYLQAKTGKTIVTTHRQINIRPTTCPGKYFPERVVMMAYNK
jgi:hypothetical protein